VEPYQLDVADREAVMSVLAGAVQAFGPPDLLLNSAGRAIPRPFQDVSYQQFDETMRVNLYGTWNTVAALVPHMRERGGYIINTSSLAAVLPVYGYTDYCASKAGIVGFSEALRMELSPMGIGVSVLLPPDTATPGLEAEDRTKPAETKAVSALSNVVEPAAVVRGMFRGIARGRFLIIPTAGDRLFYFLKRAIPGIDHLILDRVVRKTQRQPEHR
jgi:NAD(P)-dependent dehydrogenase (short-subunit alcohol dehydrogenase family)